MYDAVADLSLTVENYDLVRRERATSSGFDRVTTTVALRGAGETGRGEDVTYEAEDHDPFQTAFGADLAGEYTLDSFSTALEDVDLWPEPPSRDVFRHYRRWALESAALDLALRQADTDLGSALGRSYDPMRFVVSTRLPEGEPDGDGNDGASEGDRSADGGGANEAEGGGDPDPTRVYDLLETYPDLELKLDPTPAWDADLIADLADTGAVRVVDLKGLYEETDVDTAADPAFYRRVLEGFSDAVVEDARATPETRPLLADHAERLSWDYPITGVASIEDLPFEPRWLNCKPSRFGTVESLLETIAYCEREGIRLYGGGQFELGVGRAQIQDLAALCYPDSPNDVAPGGYNDPAVQSDLPTSPLAPPEAPRGFGNYSSAK